MNKFILSRLGVYIKGTILIGLVVVFLLIVLNWIVMPMYVSQREMVKVPDVKNQVREAAVNQLTELGLEPIVTIQPFDPKLPPNSVVAQNPVVGTEVKLGRRVYISVISPEAENTTVPDLIGKSEREATILLERFKLKRGSIIYQEDKEYPENVVMGQTIPADSRVKEGSLVTLIVSKGTTKDLVVIPDLVNKSITEAQKLLLREGLSTGKINYQFSMDILPNTVIEQFPKANERAPQGKAIDLWVVKHGKPGSEPEDWKNN